MNEEYYILVDGEQTGPYTFNELIEQQPGLHTRIMAPSADTWQDACDVPELFEYFRTQGYHFPTEDNLASFWWRLVAFSIDMVLMSLILDFIIIPLLNAKGITHINLAVPFNPYKVSVHDATILQVLFFVVLLLYNSGCEVSAMQGTLGKKACGLVVVDQDGDVINVGMSLLRNIGKGLSVSFWGVGAISIFWTEGKQGLYDLLAKTYVVRKNA